MRKIIQASKHHSLAGITMIFKRIKSITLTKSTKKIGEFPVKKLNFSHCLPELTAGVRYLRRRSQS